MSHNGGTGNTGRGLPGKESLKRKRETSPASTSLSDDPNVSSPEMRILDVANGENIENKGLGVSDSTATMQYLTDETTKRAVSPVRLDSPPQYERPPQKRLRLGGSAVLNMLDSIDESAIEVRPKDLSPQTATMIFLTPNDIQRERTIPRLGLMDNGSMVSVTYKSVLSLAGLPFYYHDVGDSSLMEGIKPGVPVKPIGTASLFWHEEQTSARGADRVYQTAFLVLPDEGTEPKVDFILGRDWLHEAKMMLVRRQASEDDGKISEPKGRDTVFFAAQVGMPSEGA